MNDSADTRFAIFDRIPIGVCVLDHQFTVRFWNSCLEDWTRIPRAEIFGQDLAARFSHLREPRYRQRMEAIFAGGPPTIFSSQLHRQLIPAPLPDGSLRIQQTVVTPLATADRNGFDALLSIQDVTALTRSLEEARRLRDQALLEVRERQRAEEERRRLEAKMQHAQKLESLGILAGGIAHDFNNLLVGILGNADLALAELDPPPRARRFLETIIKSAERAADLSNQMLSYSGKGTFVTCPLDLSASVREAVPLLEVSISKKAVLRCELTAEIPMIEGDPTQIQQILMNLITNASDAIGEARGEIVVATGVTECEGAEVGKLYPLEALAAGRYVYFEVVDNGCGMDDATREKIFDPFFTTKFAGRGLGLAAVLGIVRGHRGALRVESEPDCGTAFRVFFPAVAVPTEIAAAPAAALSSVADTPLPHGVVLVVDDEETVRDLARDALEGAGFSVLVEDDGRRAVETFNRAREQIVAVLLDLTMPDQDGRETFEVLRGLAPGLPIILSSGYSEKAAAELFSGRALSGFIQKPYRAEALITQIRRACAGRYTAEPAAVE